MKDNTVVFAWVVGHALALIASIGGAVFLAAHEKPGWGWLIFLAAMLGGWGLKCKKDNEPEELA